MLGCSGKLYVQATASQDLASWVGAHIGAWESFGGVCEVTVPDNLRAGVSKACFYDPEINPTYAELAAFYDTVVLPTRVRRITPGQGRGRSGCAGGPAVGARPAPPPAVLLLGRAERGNRR